MGKDIITVVAWIFGLILAYLLLVHGNATTSIAGASFSGGINTIKALQGR